MDDNINQGHSLNWWIRIIGIGIVFIVALIAIYSAIFIYGLQLPTFQSEEEVVVEITPYNPTGYILMNLAKDTGESGLYAFDFESETITALPGDLKFPHFNDDEDRYLATVETSSTTSLGEGSIYSNLYEVDIENESFKLLFSSLKEDGREFRRPRISPLGDFYTLEMSPDTTDGRSIYSLEDWDIYLGRRGEVPTPVVKGAFANFTPAIHEGLIYLDSEGVHYIYLDPETIVEDELVFPSTSEVIANNHLALARDGSRFAVTNVGAKEVVVVYVESWRPFLVGNVRRYDVAGFWPTFSPDGRYLAIQEVDISEIGEDPTQARLTIIDLATGERRTVADLSGFVQMQLFMNDWVKNLPNYE